MTPLLTATISIASVLLGALFGHLLTARRSRRDELSRMRLEAYTDFIRATSHLVAARRTGRTTDELQELGALNDSKARICICADEKVVDALGMFWLQGGTLEREQEILTFSRLCAAMRESLGNERLGMDVRLSDIVFKLEPSTYSYRSARASS